MAEVATRITTPALTVEPIIREKLRSLSPANRTIFDPEKHLSFVHEPEVLSLEDLDLPKDSGISPVAVSQPFPLFNEDAIRNMREEILTHEVWDNCLHSTEFAGCQLRGHCPKYAPFMHQAWKDPKTLSIISKIAGIDLVPVMDLEIGNINVSVTNSTSGTGNISEAGDEIPVTKWHYDSYPFVCVVMMSDASAMVGGETAIKTGSGEILKVRGPQMGCAVVLQGRCISHQALAALGGAERITMVTAFRPRDALVPDSSVLTTIRPISDPSQLYFQWTEYRVAVLQERLRIMLEALRNEHRANKPTNVQQIKELLQEQENWLASTNSEIH
ncbi:hypothetical protein BP6252_13790 [Coleophoma cylindrospora]|uniref:Fe2OG dioxygenase domain-containing protein n=1 Tax=Coleophoma cylindrospora TaxID=1849047 RepID=A0A3D8Q6J3_9HELO|nr:hypothetical protein BP6252_13790 [Coleophoma cylindrospora]